MHKKTALIGRNFGGLYWTRTSDPIDVNDVLYQLSQQTIVNFGISFTMVRHIRTEKVSGSREFITPITGDAIYDTTMGTSCQSQISLIQWKGTCGYGRNRIPDEGRRAPRIGTFVLLEPCDARPVRDILSCPKCVSYARIPTPDAVAPRGFF